MRQRTGHNLETEPDKTSRKQTQEDRVCVQTDNQTESDEINEN